MTMLFLANTKYERKKKQSINSFKRVIQYVLYLWYVYYYYYLTYSYTDILLALYIFLYFKKGAVVCLLAGQRSENNIFAVRFIHIIRVLKYVYVYTYYLNATRVCRNNHHLPPTTRWIKYNNCNVPETWRRRQRII